MKLGVLALSFSLVSALTVNALADGPPKKAATSSKKKTALAVKPSESERKTTSEDVTITTPSSAKPKGKGAGKTSKDKKTKKEKPPCFAAPVEIMRGAEIDTFSITKCDGSLAPAAIEHLSVLARPGSAAKPDKPWLELAKLKTTNISAGIRRVDPGLGARLQQVVSHFTVAGKTPRLSVISGYRPSSVGSFHAAGKALDFRVEGVANETLVAYCKTLPDTGCGYYPNSVFVHMDVRPTGTGHVQWIDGSGPGESPHYVSAWPPPPDHSTPNTQPPSQDSDLMAPLPVDEHPSEAIELAAPNPVPFDPAGPSDFDVKNGVSDKARW
ncbi:MAG TPA: DUF882 domain-containing protein [Polyangiaceae bacterium]